MARPLSEYVFSRQVGANRIAYFDQGQGAVLVLIHGMFGDHLDWEPVLAPLAKSMESCLRVATGSEPALAFTAIYLQFFTYFLLEKLFGGKQHLGMPDERASAQLIWESGKSRVTGEI